MAVQLKSSPKTYADQVARELRNLKTAAGPASDRGYEQVLARLGMTIIQEQLPEAMEYFQGMSLLDRRDDGKFVAGFFTFNVGGAIVDIPVFLIDGKVKGYQVLFIRHSKLFLPAEAEILDFILKQQKSRTGSPAMGEGEQRDRHTAMNVKVYSDQNRFLSKRSAIEAFESIITAADSEAMYTPGKKQASLAAPEWLDLLNSKGARSYLRTVAYYSPKLERKIAAALGADWATGLDKFERELDTFIKTAAAPKLDLFEDDTLDLTGYKAPLRSKIAAYETVPDGYDPAVALPEIAKLGAFFVDQKQDQSRQAMVIVDNYSEFTSPLYSGEFEIVLADGSLRTVNVVRPTDVISLGDTDAASLIYDPSTRAVGMVAPSQLAAKNLERTNKIGEDVKTLYDAAGVTAIANSGSDSVPCIIVFEGGKCTPPVYLGTEEENNTFSISPVYIDVQGGTKSENSRASYTQRTGQTIRVDKLAVDSTGTLTVPKLVKIDTGGILRVPGTAKMLPLAENESSGPMCCGSTTKRLVILPLSDLDMEEMRKSASFSIRRLTDSYLDLNGKTVHTKHAVFKLLHSGLSKQAAIDVVTSATPLAKHYLIVDVDATVPELAAGHKIAYAMRDEQYQFSEPSPAVYGEGGYHIPVREEQPVSEAIPSTGMQWADTSSPPWSSEETPYTRPNVSDGGSPEQSEAKQLANDPGYIFDNQMFVSMLKHVNPGVERGRLLTGLIKCCDSVGRAYFLLLAHGQEFADAYGIADADEMEEQLLTLLEVGGKQLVQLFNRSVSVGVDLGMTASIDS